LFEADVFNFFIAFFLNGFPDKIHALFNLNFGLHFQTEINKQTAEVQADNLGKIKMQWKFIFISKGKCTFSNMLTKLNTILPVEEPMCSAFIVGTLYVFKIFLTSSNMQPLRLGFST
jgi:hypothetical protein